MEMRPCPVDPKKVRDGLQACCLEGGAACMRCPYSSLGYDTCIHQLQREAADYIRRLERMVCEASPAYDFVNRQLPSIVSALKRALEDPEVLLELVQRL